jgi:hypothetical protein
MIYNSDTFSKMFIISVTALTFVSYLAFVSELYASVKREITLCNWNLQSYDLFSCLIYSGAVKSEIYR